MCQLSQNLKTFLARIVEQVNSEPAVFVAEKPVKKLKKKEYKKFVEDRIQEELKLF